MSVRSPAAQYLQYRIRLESEEAAGTPVVDSVEVRYVAANRKPSVSYDDPSAIRYVKKEGELSWDASDPDSDTLRYHLYYSADQGATWSEIAKNIDETTLTLLKFLQDIWALLTSTTGVRSESHRPPWRR